MLDMRALAKIFNTGGKSAYRPSRLAPLLGRHDPMWNNADMALLTPRSKMAAPVLTTKSPIIPDMGHGYFTGNPIDPPLRSAGVPQVGSVLPEMGQGYFVGPGGQRVSGTQFLGKTQAQTADAVLGGQTISLAEAREKILGSNTARAMDPDVFGGNRIPIPDELVPPRMDGPPVSAMGAPDKTQRALDTISDVPAAGAPPKIASNQPIDQISPWYGRAAAGVAAVGLWEVFDKDDHTLQSNRPMY